MGSFLVIVSALYACTEPNKKDDPEKLKAVLVDYFDGIKSKDLKKMNKNTTADYLLFEGGKVWDNDSLWAALDFKNRKIEFRLDSFRIHVDNESGHISYFNHEDVYTNDTLTKIIECIENATFRKEGGTWKIDFLQSTQKSND